MYIYVKNYIYIYVTGDNQIENYYPIPHTFNQINREIDCDNTLPPGDEKGRVSPLADLRPIAAGTGTGTGTDRGTSTSPPPPPPPPPPGRRFDHTPGHDHHKHSSSSVPKSERPSSSTDLLLQAHSNLAIENGFGPTAGSRESRSDSIEGGPLDPLGDRLAHSPLRHKAMSSDSLENVDGE